MRLRTASRVPTSPAVRSLIARPVTLRRPRTDGPLQRSSLSGISITILSYLLVAALFWMMQQQGVDPWQVASWLLGSLVIFAIAVRRFVPWLVAVPAPAAMPRCPDDREASPPPWMLMLAITLTLLSARARYVAGNGPVGLRVYMPWLGGIALFALAAWYPTLRRWRQSPAIRLPRHLPTVAVASWAILLVAAVVPRFLWLDRGPDFANEDEGRFILMAMAARDGSMVNPFASGWLGVPQLYPALEGMVASVLGTDIAAYRALGGILGVATVVATWRLGRWLIGTWPAYLGAVILATMPFHLRFSRTALNHVTDSLTLALSLLFLIRATRSGRRGDALISGIAVGIGWYGYWGARVFPVIVALLLGIAATDRTVGWRRAVTIAIWSSFGFLATTAPLLMTYRLHPAELHGRFHATSGVSRAALREAPWDTIRAFLERFRDALLMPIADNRYLFYLHEAPFLGWPVALLLLAGVGIWMARLAHHRSRRQVLWLIMPWGIIAAGIAATDVPQSQRAVALAPIWALAAGTGLVGLFHVITTRMRQPPRRSLALIAAVLVAMLGVADIRWYMDDDRQRATFGGDHRSLFAWDLGWRLDPGHTPNPPRVLFAGPPFVFIEDWGNLRFQAPEARVADIETPIDVPGDVPEIPADTVLAVVPERADEVCTIVAAAPELVVAEARARDGSLLYVAFYREGPVPWHPGETPAGTTFEIVPPPDCAQ